jgi:hypothetical protein
MGYAIGRVISQRLGEMILLGTSLRECEQKRFTLTRCVER